MEHVPTAELIRGFEPDVGRIDPTGKFDIQSLQAFANNPGIFQIIFNQGIDLFTPGFMGTDDITQAAEGIERMVEELARRLAVAPGPARDGTT